MWESKRLFWLVTLALVTGGCSSYRVVPFPRVEDEVGRAEGWTTFPVQVGDEVRLTLTDNRAAAGRVLGVSSGTIILDPVQPTEYRKYPENLTGDHLPRRMEIDAIRILEVQKTDYVKTAFAVVLIAGPVVAAIASANWSMDMPSVGQ